MGWLPTLVLMAAALGSLLLARARLAAPSEPGRVRMVPWTAILFLAILGALVLLAHMMTLSGYVWPQR